MTVLLDNGEWMNAQDTAVIRLEVIRSVLVALMLSAKANPYHLMYARVTISTYVKRA